MINLWKTAKVVATWFVDVTLMASRVKAIHAARLAEDNPLPKCWACGRGRVHTEARRTKWYVNGDYTREGAEYFGRCDDCEQLWEVTLGPERPNLIATVDTIPDDDPKPDPPKSRRDAYGRI